MYGDKCSLSHLQCAPSLLGYKTRCLTEDVRSVPLPISHVLLGQALHYHFPPYSKFANASSTVLKVGVSPRWWNEVGRNRFDNVMVHNSWSKTPSHPTGREKKPKIRYRVAQMAATGPFLEPAESSLPLVIYICRAIFRRVCKIAKSGYSVRLSAWNTSASTGQIFVKFDTWIFFDNLSRSCKFH